MKHKLKTLSKIILDREYINNKVTVDYKIVCPDGFFTISKLKLPNNLKEVLLHLGASIEEISYTRFKRGAYIEIGGVLLEWRKPNEFKYISNDRYESTGKYRNILKPILESQGYKIQEHSCKEIVADHFDKECLPVEKLSLD